MAVKTNIKPFLATAFLFFSLVALSAFNSFATTDSDVVATSEGDKVVEKTLKTSSYAKRDAFILNASDASYASVIASVSSGGDGSALDPYIIEGYNITTAVEINVTIQSATQETNLSIGIIDVSDHIVVRNCILGNASIVKYTAIGMLNSSDITVRECNITGSSEPAFGIVMCRDILLERNTLMQTGATGKVAIYFEKCNRTQLIGNRMGNSGAIALLNTNNTLIRANEMNACSMGTPPIGMYINGTNIAVVDNLMVLSGMIYIMSRPIGASNINITDNFLQNPQATYMGYWGAITVYGMAGAMSAVNVSNNKIYGASGHGVQAVAGSKGIFTLTIAQNDIFACIGKGIDINGLSGAVSPIIYGNRIRKNGLDGIYMQFVGGALVGNNYIAGQHNPLYSPPMPPLGGFFPSSGIMLVDCPVGGNIITNNTIYDNDYGVVLYDATIPNMGNIVQKNIITYNYYYAVMILDVVAMKGGAAGQSIGNVIVGNDVYKNNLGNPIGGAPTPEIWSLIVASQVFEEWTHATIGAGNIWGGNYYNDESLNQGFGGNLYWFDYGLFVGVPPPPPPAGKEGITPPTVPNWNTAPTVTPLNASGFVYDGDNACLVWKLSDLNKNNNNNGLRAWAEWNGTDVDFSYETDELSYLKIPLKDLESGKYNFTCYFNDTMDLKSFSKVDFEIRTNDPPTVSTTNASSYSFGEWVVNKGKLVFTVSDPQNNIDEVWVLGNLTANQKIALGASGGTVSVEIPETISSGTYSCKVRANDTVNLTGEKKIAVTILPNTEPEVSAKNGTVEMTVGEEGVEISWSASDPDGNPSSYVILMDDEEIDSGEWDGEDVSLLLDDLELEEGEYDFTLVCEDTMGATDQDIVTVVVVAEELSWWEQLWAWILSIILAILSLFGLAVYLVARKRRKSDCPCKGQENCWCDT